MKFVVYSKQKKITVNNAWSEEMEHIRSVVGDSLLKDMKLSDLQFYNVKITSTRSVWADTYEDIDNDEILNEISEGIDCRQETVN